VVAALALSLGAMVAGSASAGEGGSALIASALNPSAEVVKAREGAVDVASSAVQVAETVRAQAAEAAIDATQLEALQTATTHLDELIADATADDTIAARGATVSRSAERETADESEAVAAPAPADPAAPVDVLDPASAFELTPVVPTIPPASGKEDATTAQLREAVATVATLTTTVRESAEAKKVADAAAAAAAAEAAAAADAAAQAAAELEAQRAAWKQSLLGFANGKIPESALCSVGFDASVRLRCDAAEQLDILNTAYAATFGTNLTVSDSYRSYAGQIACKRTKGYLCATPGTSNHGSGIAVDLGGGIQQFGTAQHNWMVANAAGLSWTQPAWAGRGGSKPEAWHWEYSG
jgi:LAS superfamily LD-carboxypeptidase LdcB